MVDINELRDELLISQRESYENDFFSVVEIEKSNELDEQIFCHEYGEDYLIFEFESNISKRDEKLIKEREEYEASYFSIEELIKEKENFENTLHPIYELLTIEEWNNMMVQKYEENFVFHYEDYSDYNFDYNYDFDYYEDYGYLDDYQAFQRPSMEASYGCCGLLDYIPNDDLFDNLDGCDYPEGPDENLLGFRYPEPEYDDCDDFYDAFEFECDIFDNDYEYLESVNYYDYLFEENKEEIYIQELIKEHLEEERKYLESLGELEYKEEVYLPPGCEELIFC